MKKQTRAAMLLAAALLLSGFASAFADVPDGAYYADAVTWAAERGITNGVGNNQFGSDSNVTRGQAVTFLWRAMGQPAHPKTGNTFKDVKQGSYYYDAVLWAVENGITNGVGDYRFDPDGAVTRGQMITFLWRTKGSPDDTGGAWHEPAERWANAKGLLDGTAWAYSTNGECPRCDVVYYLWKEVHSGSGDTGSTGTTGQTQQPQQNQSNGTINFADTDIFGGFPSYDEWIDYLYDMYEGKYTREQLIWAHPNVAEGSTKADDPWAEGWTQGGSGSASGGIPRTYRPTKGSTAILNGDFKGWGDVSYDEYIEKAHEVFPNLPIEELRQRIDPSRFDR